MLPQAVNRFDTRVALLMTRHPIAIADDETVDVATDLLKHCRIRHLPVVGAARVLSGVLSLRDVLPAKEDALVGEIMRRPVVTATTDEPVVSACERMLQQRVSCLPVLEGEKLVGIFTATDALRHATSTLFMSAPAVRVEHVMTPKPLTTIAPDAPLVVAWALMRQARVRHLAVVAGEQLVGILSDRNLLAAGRAWLDDPGRTAANGAVLVADAMTERVVTVSPDHEAADAAHTMLRLRLSALPVMRGRQLVGMLEVADFLYWSRSRR